MIPSNIKIRLGYTSTKSNFLFPTYFAFCKIPPSSIHAIQSAQVFSEEYAGTSRGEGEELGEGCTPSVSSLLLAKDSVSTEFVH